MTDQQYPITPPPELVEQWVQNTRSHDSIGAFPEDFNNQIAAQAARWGADMELEACCEWLKDTNWDELREAAYDLRADRRPKPPSLKEQALAEINKMEGAMYSAGLGCNFTATRRALEQLDD